MTIKPSRDQQIAYEMLCRLPRAVNLPDALKWYISYLTEYREVCYEGEKSVREEAHNRLLSYASIHDWERKEIEDGRVLLYWDDWLDAYRAWSFEDEFLQGEDKDLYKHRIRVATDPKLFEHNGIFDQKFITDAWSYNRPAISAKWSRELLDTTLVITEITRFTKSYHAEERERRKAEENLARGVSEEEVRRKEIEGLDLAYEAGTRSPEIDSALGLTAKQNHPAGARDTLLTESIVTLPLALAGRRALSVSVVADEHYREIYGDQTE